MWLCVSGGVDEDEFSLFGARRVWLKFVISDIDFGSWDKKIWVVSNLIHFLIGFE